MVSEEIFLKYQKVSFSMFCIMASTATNTKGQRAKNIWLIQDFSRNISTNV